MSTWDDRLRSLFKKAPSKEIKRAVLNMMESGSDDRSAALVSTALADTGLVMGIVAILRPREPKDVDALFWAKKATYPTFNSRIEKAAQLNLIGPRTRNNLDVARQIRNVFVMQWWRSHLARPKSWTPAIK